MVTAEDRWVLLDRVADTVLAGCVNLEAPELFSVAGEYQRPDGSAVFARPGEARYTHRRVLDAETRLLAAAQDSGAPVATGGVALSRVDQPLHRADGRVVRLAADQAGAVRAVASSGRRLDVLVGPAEVMCEAA